MRKWCKTVLACAEYMNSPEPRTPVILPLFLCQYGDTELRQAESDAIALGLYSERAGDDVTAWVWGTVATWAATVREFKAFGLEYLFDRLAERCQA